MSTSLLAILIPFVGALFTIIARQKPLQIFWATLSTIATLIAARFLQGDAGFSTLWIPGFNSYFELNPQGAASILVLIAAVVMVPTVGWAASKVTERTGGFLFLLLLMQAGLNGLFLAKDLVVYYIFWEATLIPSIFMLGMWGGAQRRQAATKYLIYAVAGSFVMLVSILAIKPLSGASSYRFSDLIAATPNLPLATQLWLFTGFALAFAVKLPMFPLHSWLIDFHEQNHPSGAADVAGTLYKVGGFGFFAWALPLLPDAARAAAPLMMFLCAFTAVYAAWLATSQTHLKRMMAYASLSHMGIVGVGIFGLHISGLNGAMFLLAAQMLSTGGLFLITGMLYERRKTFDIDAYGGLAKSAPALAALTLFILFTSIGVPGLANFPGEFMSLMGAFQTQPVIAIFATLSVIAAGVYGVNLYQRLYQGEQREAVEDANEGEWTVLLPILIGILWLGIAPSGALRQIDLQGQLAVPTASVASESKGMPFGSAQAPVIEISATPAPSVVAQTGEGQ
jgi:NADH-quinone oxidoreductase subunit M